MKKHPKMFLIIIVVILMAYFGVSGYVANEVMVIPKLPLKGTPASVGLAYEDITFPSRDDNIALKGWFIERGASIILIVNGGYQNRLSPEEGTLELSKDLVQTGYSVLLFDLRGRGESEGKGLVLVNTERDIGGAIDYVKTRNYSDIVIIGFSTGAVSALSFATQESVTAIVADGCFSNITETLIKRVNEETAIPKLLIRFFTPGIFLMTKIIYGYEKVNPVNIVSDVKCPILFIYGEADDLIPINDAYKLYEASNNALNELWVVPGATHCQAYRTDPIGYIDRVASFVGRD